MKKFGKYKRNSQQQTHLGKSFLTQDLIINALSIFDLANLDQCYRTLNQALLEAIRQPIALDDA